MKFAVRFGGSRSVGPFEVVVSVEGAVKVCFTEPVTGDHYEKNLKTGEKVSTAESTLTILETSRSHQAVSFGFSEQKKPRLRTVRRREARRKSAKNTF